jgi:glycosyltransferase involved in cell wall biosynthesis
MPPGPISIVVPARDVAATIDAQLAALASQLRGTGHEVVVVDNGSTDDTRARIEAWSAAVPAIRTVDGTRQPGAAYARNVGSEAAVHDRIAYCDADDVVGADWIDGMATALGDHDLASGPIDLTRLNPPCVYAWRSVPGWDQLPAWHGFLPSALSCNLGTTRRAFAALGGFDTSLVTGEDFDYVWRAQLAGFALHHEQRALVHWRVDSDPGRYWRRHRNYGLGDVVLYRKFRSQGMPRSSVASAMADYVWLMAVAPAALRSSRKYEWLDKASLRAGKLRGSIKSRVVYL